MKWNIFIVWYFSYCSEATALNSSSTIPYRAAFFYHQLICRFVWQNLLKLTNLTSSCGHINNWETWKYSQLLKDLICSISPFCWIVYLLYPKCFQQCSNPEKFVVLFKINVFYLFGTNKIPKIDLRRNTLTSTIRKALLTVSKVRLGVGALLFNNEWTFAASSWPPQTAGLITGPDWWQRAGSMLLGWDAVSLAPGGDE